MISNSGMPIFVGKVINFKSFLPSGVKVIAHWMPWFGSPSHNNVPGYDSRDPKTCADQCALMKSMGIDAINVDWYGPDHIFENTATLHMLRACEDAGLGFSICIDKGAIPNPATDLPHCLQYISETFTPSPAYLVDAGTGKPIINFFGDPFSGNPGIDVSALKGNFLFLFQDAGGFTHAFSDGAFGWVHPMANAQDMNSAYLFGFAAAAAANPTKICWYPVYPGFDDSLASWGSKRLMQRRGGLTLLDCLSLVPSTASWVIIPTWNDHEEGTAVELSQG